MSPLRVIAWSSVVTMIAVACGGEDRVFAGGEAGGAGEAMVGQAGDSAAGGGVADGGGNGMAAAGAAGGGAELPERLDCSEAQLLTASAQLFESTTQDAGDDFDASCFSGAAEDLAIEWIAPHTDYYRFTTAGSGYDTALALLDDTCDGGELACNAEASETEVEIVRLVEQGRRVVVVMDGKAGASGDITLGIEAITCPGLDLSEETLPIELSTQNQGDNSSACGGAGKSDRALRFTPPADGLYRFSARSEAFAAIVSVEAGPSCGGQLLGCGYSRKGDDADVVRELKQGEPVTVFVDGGGGTFELDIEDVSATASCPSETPAILLSGIVSRSGSFAGAEHLLSASCAPTGDFNPTAAYVPLVERSYPLSVNLPENMSCQVRVEAEHPVAIYLLEGDACGGRELKCATAAPSTPQGFYFSSTDNGDYVLVVEDLDGYAGAFEITSSCVI